jgi:hypothetical protein
VEAQKAVESSHLRNRELIRALGTSASQFYRLLDPTNQTTSVGQMPVLDDLMHVLRGDAAIPPGRLEAEGYLHRRAPRPMNPP